MSHRLRAGAHRFSLYNDGDVVYLYDFGSKDHLRDAVAVQVILSDVENRDKKLKQIEKESLIVAYGLHQDDSREIELAVGEPLTAKEKKAAKWFRAQKSLIRIPSGRLRIESSNSLTIGDDEPTDEGETLEIPPGDYVLTLERVNWEEMEESLQTADLPTEFISLCPVEQAKPQKPKAFLSWGGVVGDKAKWESEWKAKDGTFHGKMKSTWDGKLAVNFTPAAAAKLGVRVGEVLHLDGEGVSTTFLYLGVRTAYGIERAFGKEIMAGAAGVAPLISTPQYAETPGATLICFEGPTALGLPKCPEAQSVTIHKTGAEGFAPSDNSFVRDVTVGKDAVDGRVLTCSRKYLNVNILPVHLLKLGYKWGGPITMTIGEESRQVFIENDVSKGSIAEAKASAAKHPERVGLSGRVMNHWEVRGLEIWDLVPLVGDDLFLDAKPGDRVSVRVT